MPLQLLPEEILEEITSHLTKGRDLAHWAATSRRHYAIASLALYRSFGRYALEWAAKLGHPDTARRCVALAPETAQLVHLTAAAVSNCEPIVELLLGLDRLHDKFASRPFDEDWCSPVCRAAISGSVGALRQLLALQWARDSVMVADAGWTPLELALMNGEGEAALVLLANGVSASHSYYGDRPSPLQLAIKARMDVKFVQALLDHGADLAAEPLTFSYATEFGSKDVVELLLKNGADVEEPQASPDKPIHRAAKSTCSSQILDTLLQYGADPQALDNLGRSPLHSFVKCRAPAGLRMLLERGAAAIVNCQDHTESRLTPLHTASLGYATSAKLLLDYGADPTAGDLHGKTPLHYAATPEIAKLLVQAGADIDARCHLGHTPLNIALPGRNLAVTEWLIRNGADVHPWPFGKEMPQVWTVVRYGSLEILKLLLERDVVVQAPSGSKTSPIEEAIRQKDAPMVEVLRLHAASHHTQLPFGDLISKALSFGSMEIAYSLLVNGGDFCVRDVRGKDMMLEAAIRLEERPDPTTSRAPPKRGAEVIKMLISDHGAYPNLVRADSTGGQTPLVAAIRSSATSGDPYKVQALLECGADPNLAANHGHHPPLYVAATYGLLSFVKPLVEYGANLHFKTPQGETLLMTAAGGSSHGGADDQGRLDTCKWLLEHGLDATIVDSAGRTAREYRRRQLEHRWEDYGAEDGLSEMLAEYERLPAPPAEVPERKPEDGFGQGPVLSILSRTSSASS